MPQPHALNAGPSKAGSEWFSHVFAWLWRQGRCSMLLLKMTLCALFGCYVNNVEENGHPGFLFADSIVFNGSESLKEIQLLSDMQLDNAD